MSPESWPKTVLVYGNRWQMFCQDPIFEIDLNLLAGFTVRTDLQYHVDSSIKSNSSFFLGNYVVLQSNEDELYARQDWQLRDPLSTEPLSLGYIRRGCTRTVTDRGTWVELKEVRGEKSVELASSRIGWRDSDVANRIAFRLTLHAEVDAIELALLVLFHHETYRGGSDQRWSILG